ncbi:MAG: hypothetical protein ACREFC_12850, partial [Stellaceae bacterium]
PYVQNSIPTWHSPIRDAATGRWITSHIMSQDFVAWMGQGAISDRENEHLGSSDKGIAQIRRRFFEDLDAIKAGRDPKAVIRDEKLRDLVPLPIMNREILTKGVTREQLAKDPNARILLRPFAWQVGQPESVKRAYADAMGVEIKG